ncbi:MAG TPA: D-2-hydroxyacid dehydrogenase [Bacillales bacterium]|nr:D-2-hydroxyacid dehydrogenase [Bacillales bacterium]
MLLVTIDEFSDQQFRRLIDLSRPRLVHLERDLKNSRLDLNQTEIWITYGFDVTKENLDRMPGLKWIQVFQAGIEHIPLEELNRRGIRLTNVKGIHGIPMSEYVMSMVLYVARDLARFIREQKLHAWNREDLVDEAFGKTMAVFGAGTIGTMVAEKAKMFDMRVIGVNTSGESRSPFDEMYTLDDKLEVLRQSDFIVLLLPVTEATYHCIGREELKQMKPGAYLINTGRGALVDTEALVSELRAGKIRGVALDVFEEDPLPKDHPLWDMENVFITPHLSAKTVRYLDRCIDKFEPNFECFENGDPMVNQVDVAKGY